MLRPVIAYFGAFFTLLITQFAIADPVEPSGPIVLVVRDAEGSVWQFDRAMLQAMDWQTITTVTSFTEGAQEFSGVPLASIMNSTGVSGSIVDAVALNDYRVEIPVEHVEKHDMFLALDQNGTPMRVRDRGPIWIIYPSPTLQAATDRFDSFMIWQLKELTFRP